MVIEDISRKIAKELGLPIGIVDMVHRSQYQFLVDTMREYEKDVHLIYIGKFVKKKKRNAKPKTDIPGMEELNI